MNTKIQYFTYQGEIILKAPELLQRTTKKSLFIALDVSGSMDTSIKTACGALKNLLDQVHDQFNNVVLMEYSSDTIVTELTKKNYAEYLSTVKVRGMTNFVSVLQHIIDRSACCENPITVLFFTDGNHNEGGDVDLHIEKVKQYFSKSEHQISFECIGFTSSHNANLLNKICKAGNVSGTFQYAKDQTTLVECTSNIENVLHHGSKNIKIKIDEKEHQFKSGFLVLKANSDELIKKEIVIELEEGKVVVELEELKDDAFGQIDYVISLQNLKLEKIATNLENGIDEKNLARIDEELTGIIEDKRFKSLNKLDKMIVHQRVSQCKEMVASFYNIIKKNFKKSLTNEEMATLISSSYDHITKRSVQKRLDKMVLSSMELFKDSEKKKEKIFGKIDFDSLKVSKESLEFYKCAISTCDYIESMKQKESICFTVKIGRSEAAIMDPSQIKIYDLGKTIMSTGAFSDSIQFKLQNVENLEEIHGGFTLKDQGSVVQGIAREDITGLIPLYINEDHWKLQKENIKPILGWMTTLDAFGYHDSQLRTIPFIVLEKFFTYNKPSDFHSVIFFQIMRTCCKLYEQNNMRVLDFSNPENTTPDIISSLFLLIGKLLVDPLEYKDVKGLILSILEEDFRRKLKHSPTTFEDKIRSMMDCINMVEIRKDLKPEELHNEEKQFTEREFDANKIKDMTEIVEDLCSGYIPHLIGFYVLYKKFNKDLGKICKEVDENFGIVPEKYVKEFQEIMKEPFPKTIKGLAKVLEMESFTTSQVNALVIQAYDHKVNSDRRDAIKQGKFLNPFTESKTICGSYIEKQRKSQISHIKTMCQSAYLFANRFERFTLDHLATKSNSNSYFSKICSKAPFKCELLKMNTNPDGSVYSRAGVTETPYSNCLKEVVISVGNDDVVIVTNDTGNIKLTSVAKALKVDPSKVDFISRSSFQGFSIRSIPCFGFENTKVIINKRILKMKDEFVICASGDPQYLMKINVNELVNIPNVEFIDILTE